MKCQNQECIRSVGIREQQTVLNMLNIIILGLFIFCSFFSPSFSSAFERSTRQPKLFYVSSTTSTTTLSTQTVCYVASSTDIQMLTCKKRKKRNILTSMMSEPTNAKDIQPASSLKSLEEAVEKIENVEIDISSGLDIHEREGKFLKYWITTTLTTTVTTYTATSSLASLICTPAGYTNQGCPGTG